MICVIIIADTNIRGKKMKVFDGLQSFFESLGEYTKNFSNLFLIFVINLFVKNI